MFGDRRLRSRLVDDLRQTRPDNTNRRRDTVRLEV